MLTVRYHFCVFLIVSCSKTKYCNIQKNEINYAIYIVNRGTVRGVKFGRFKGPTMKGGPRRRKRDLTTEGFTIAISTEWTPDGPSEYAVQGTQKP